MIPTARVLCCSPMLVIGHGEAVVSFIFCTEGWACIHTDDILLIGPLSMAARHGMHIYVDMRLHTYACTRETCPTLTLSWTHYLCRNTLFVRRLCKYILHRNQPATRMYVHRTRRPAGLASPPL